MSTQQVAPPSSTPSPIHPYAWALGLRWEEDASLKRDGGDSTPVPGAAGISSPPSLATHTGLQLASSLIIGVPGKQTESTRDPGHLPFLPGTSPAPEGFSGRGRPARLRAGSLCWPPPGRLPGEPEHWVLWSTYLRASQSLWDPSLILSCPL